MLWMAEIALSVASALACSAVVGFNSQSRIQTLGFQERAISGRLLLVAGGRWPEDVGAEVVAGDFSASGLLNTPGKLRACRLVPQSDHVEGGRAAFSTLGHRCENWAADLAGAPL